MTTIATPCLVVERSVLEANCQQMAGRMSAVGLNLRPHLKTAKCIEVARMAVDGHDGGIAVSTAAEAFFFAEAGFRDITWAVCVSPDKVERIAPLVRQGVRVSLIVDDGGVVVAMNQVAARLGIRLPVLVEVDTGGGRTGVAFDSAAPLSLARAIQAASNLDFDGVLTHHGGAYRARTRHEVETIANEELRRIVTVAQALRCAGLPCPRVSVGSTPTAVVSSSLRASLEGITEMRPGVYVFNDLFQRALGVCSLDDLALSVLATVISRDPSTRRVVVDAGALALSCDRTADEVCTLQAERGDHAFGPVGYGLVVDLRGTIRWPGLYVRAVSQEHGILDWQGEDVGAADLPVGSRVRILPNHACNTAAAYGSYAVVDRGGDVITRWSRCSGW